MSISISPFTLLLEIGQFLLCTCLMWALSASIEMSFFYLRFRDLGATPRTGWQPSEERWWSALTMASLISGGAGHPWFWYIAAGTFAAVALAVITRRRRCSGLQPWQARRARVEIQE